MRVIQSLLICSICFCSLSSCSDKPKTEENTPDIIELPVAKEEVNLKPLQKRDFMQQLVSNGKVRAREFADLQFRVTTEPIVHIYVREGDQVKAGQKIAELDTRALQNNLKQAKSRLEQSRLDMKDVLIGQGYDPDKANSIPAEVQRLAQIKSNYELYQTQLEQAEFEMENAILYAPIGGIVANLDTRAHNLPGTEPFCRIIQNSDMEVVFTVMENELALVRPGNKVNIMPYTQTDVACQGTVTEINPMVDENGQVKVRASVQGNRSFLDGMNIKVTVERSASAQFVVPKSAVVLRTGKQVIFTYEDGKAKWNYVTVTMENLTEYAIEGESLEEGMQVIVSGNLNLAHDAPVQAVKGK